MSHKVVIPEPTGKNHVTGNMMENRTLKSNAGQKDGNKINFPLFHISSKRKYAARKRFRLV